MRPETSRGVMLPEGETGSSFLHRALAGAVARFEGVFRGARFPHQAEVFRATYGDALARFEAARLASPQRIDIARHLVAHVDQAFLLRTDDGRSVPLHQGIVGATAPTLETRAFSGKPGLRVEVPLDGRVYAGRDALVAVDRLLADHHLTQSAHRALSWIIDHIEQAGGALDLSQHRFALLGAAAELAPTSMLLAGGATVLWVDVRSPGEALHETDALAGQVRFNPAKDDLLTAPGAALAAVRQFAEEGPVHLGLFAYAPGAGRELRIAGAMDLIARAAGKVRSVSMLVSPTSPGALQPEDRRVSDLRKGSPASWQRGLQAVRALRGPGYVEADSVAVARAPMSIQGAAYQAAQYLTKIVSSEVFAADGLTVSANVAGITNTRSLKHPLFQVAFAGAPAFGVRIFEPATTRALNGLLMLHDLLNPEAPAASTRKASADDKARDLRAQQVHGGVYDLPWQFESAVRAAAVIGAAKRPGLLLQR